MAKVRDLGKEITVVVFGGILPLSTYEVDVLPFALPAQVGPRGGKVESPF